jgi:hypothetical protein
LLCADLGLNNKADFRYVKEEEEEEEEGRKRGGIGHAEGDLVPEMMNALARKHCCDWRKATVLSGL